MLRVFHDRMRAAPDRAWFLGAVKRATATHLQEDFDYLFRHLDAVTPPIRPSRAFPLRVLLPSRRASASRMSTFAKVVAFRQDGSDALDPEELRRLFFGAFMRPVHRRPNGSKGPAPLACSLALVFSLSLSHSLARSLARSN